MRKVFFLFVFHLALILPNSCISQAAEWGNWNTLSCTEGLQGRVKSIGFNKYVSKYEWIAQIKNNYGVKATFSMYWTVGGEKQSIGQFTVFPGGTTNAVSYYFVSNAEMCYVSLSDVCFGNDVWCKCKADCDVQPGVPNQLSEEACKALTSPPKNNSSSSSTNNSSRTTTNTYSNNTTVNNTNTTATGTSGKPISSYNKCGHINYAQCDVYIANGNGNEWCHYNDVGYTASKQINSQQLGYQNSLNQYNEAQIQNTISNIQNTPINTFEVGKLEIKNIKRQPASGTGVDRGSVSSISGLDKIEMEFPELANKNDDQGFSHAKPFPTMERAVAILRGAIDWQHPETGGKMDFDLTIDEQGTVIGVSLLSEPRKKELEDQVSSQILRHPLVYHHTPAERNGKQVRDNISYSIVYSSAVELEKEKKLKWQSEGKKKNPRTVPLDNGQDQELKDNEILIDTKDVTPLSSFSKVVILAKINELKNLPGDTYKMIKGIFDLEFLNNADLTNEKNNIKDTPTPSYSSDRLTMVNGVLHSVRRVNNKMSILTPIEK